MSANDHSTVSVIIPTYNRADLILESLTSVFAQTYRDFEIIVVDDGSTDNTAEILRPFSDQGKIKYIRQNNQGASSARNRGIAEARGTFLAFLDSDDLFDPEKLELQVTYYQSHPEMGLVHSGFIKFNNAEDDLGYRDTSWFFGNIYPGILMYWTTLMAMDTVIVAKSVFESVGLFDTNLVYGEDLDMWRRIARRYPFGFINRSLARIRIHEGNISGDKTNAADGLAQYLKKAFEDDPSLSAQFRQRAFSKLYSVMAYNLIGEDNKQAMQAAQRNAKLALKFNPLNLHGYIAFLSTILGYGPRKILITSWRSLRSRLMSWKRDK
jgi:glycosyltransferase involved in cell wall biosynthesis